MKINKLVILDKNEFNEQQKEELKKSAGEVVTYDDMPQDDDEAINRIKDADAVIVCWYSLSEKCIDSCRNLKYLGVVATGYSWLAAEYASKKGVTVTNVPGYSTESVAKFIINQLNPKDKTLGIIGLGKIGQRVAELGRDKEFNIIYWNRTEKSVDFKEVSLEDIFRLSDIIVIQVKSNSETKGIIKNRFLDIIKGKSTIVNTVSPSLFEDIDYTIKIINKKGLKCIFDFEEKNKFKELSKVNSDIKYTSGIAWKSPESIFNLHQIALNNLKSFLQNKPQNMIF